MSNWTVVRVRKMINETLNDLSNDSGFDESTCIFILETFVEQAKEILTKIDILMTHEIDEDTFKLLGMHLHKLKGSAGNVRAKEILALSIEAEEACMKENIEKIKENKVLISEIIEKFEVYLNVNKTTFNS